MPLRRYCNFVWWFITNGRDAQDVAKMRAKLWMPPPTATKKELEDKRNPWSPENEKAALGAFMSQVTGTVKPKSA